MFCNILLRSHKLHGFRSGKMIDGRSSYNASFAWNTMQKKCGQRAANYLNKTKDTKLKLQLFLLHEMLKK